MDGASTSLRKPVYLFKLGLIGGRQRLEFGWRPCIKARCILLTVRPSNSIAEQCGNATSGPIIQILRIARGGSARTGQIVRPISGVTVAHTLARSVAV